VTAREAAQHFVLAEADANRHAALARKIAALWGGNTCRIIRCPACGFHHAHPYVAGDAEFYALAYERDRYPAFKWEHRLTVEALLAAPVRPRTLLEVGAGDGAFLRRVVPALVRPEDVVATEFSAYGRSSLEALGVRCEATDFRALPAFLDGTFDAICLFQVLEHLDRLDDVFARLAALGHERTLLFVGTPNPRQIAFNERHGALLDMPPNHIGRWTPEALARAAGRDGWRVVSHRFEDEAWPSMARRFLTYRYLRETQREGSVPNRLRSLPKGLPRKAAEAAWILATSALAAPALLRLRSDAGGDSQWTMLERGDGP
jgi:hypothetical protein